MKTKGRLFIVSAPSGAGKSSLINAVLAEWQGEYPLERVVTFTSKVPRHCERDGIDYHFITPEQFERKAQEGFFLEWSGAYGAYYGTPNSILKGMELGTSYILIIDRVGAEQVLHKVPGAILIWITVSSIEELESRLVLRETETKAQIKSRIERARIEISAEKNEPFYHHYVENSDFSAAKLKIFSILLNTLNSSDRNSL